LTPRVEDRTFMGSLSGNHSSSVSDNSLLNVAGLKCATELPFRFRTMVDLTGKEGSSRRRERQQQLREGPDVPERKRSHPLLSPRRLDRCNAYLLLHHLESSTDPSLPSLLSPPGRGLYPIFRPFLILIRPDPDIFSSIFYHCSAHHPHRRSVCGYIGA